MDREPDEVLEVLRGIWSIQGQTSADLNEAGPQGKTCKRMADVGFGELDDDSDLRAAWRARLEREGKRDPAAGSLADLMLPPGAPRR